MFSKFIQQPYHIPHNNTEKAQHICILTSKRIILFFLSSYLIFDFSLNKVVFAHKSPGTTYRCMLAQPIDDQEIIMFRRKDARISRLKVYTGEMTELAQTNPSQSADSLIVFEKSRMTYYVKHGEQSINLYGYQTKQAITLTTSASYIQKFNELDTLVIYSQTLGSCSFTLLNCTTNTKVDHKLQPPSTSNISKYTMQFVRSIGEDIIVVGWNRGEPTPACLWIYNLVGMEVVREIALTRMIVDIVGVYTGVVALERSFKNGQRMLEYINLNESNEQVVSKVLLPWHQQLWAMNASLKSVAVVTQTPDIQYITTVIRVHAIDKRISYLHLLEKTGTVEKYGSGIGLAVLNLFEGDDHHEDTQISDQMGDV